VRMVIELEGGLIRSLITDEPIEILLLDHDAPLPGIDDEPEETVIDYDGNEVICDEIKPEIEPLRTNYFFAMHEAQNYELEYL